MAEAGSAEGKNAEGKNQEQSTPEPRGLGEHTRGLAGEYAHEQGWGLDEENRSKEPEGAQNMDGGDDYEYGARDFGDEPVNTALDPQASGPMQNRGTKGK